jgi:hypothetical protein
VTPFLARGAPAPAPPPIQVPPAMASTPGINLQTPMPAFGVDPVEQTQAFQNVIMNIVQRGLLNDLMDSMIVDYGTGLAFRAWRSKAKYLMAIYREGEKQKAHLLAGVYFLATRLNFVSANLEYLSEAYIAEMSAAMQRAGSPASWTLATVTGLRILPGRSTMITEPRLTLQCPRDMQDQCLILPSRTTGRQKSYPPDGTSQSTCCSDRYWTFVLRPKAALQMFVAPCSWGL